MFDMYKVGYKCVQCFWDAQDEKCNCNALQNPEKKKIGKALDYLLCDGYQDAPTRVFAVALSAETI